MLRPPGTEEVYLTIYVLTGSFAASSVPFYRKSVQTLTQKAASPFLTHLATVTVLGLTLVNICAENIKWFQYLEKGHRIS